MQARTLSLGLLTLGAAAFLATTPIFAQDVPNPSFEPGATPTIPTMQNPFQLNGGTTGSSTAPSFSTISGDDNSNIQEFQQRMRQEIMQKMKAVNSQRKNFHKQTTDFMKQRQTERLQLLKSCMPTNSMPTDLLRMRNQGSGDENSSGSEDTSQLKEKMKEMMQQRRDQMQACRSKLKQFEQETKSKMIEMRQQNSSQERSVLGLSINAGN